jgi:hypothetical protein
MAARCQLLGPEPQKGGKVSLIMTPFLQRLGLSVFALSDLDE